MAKAISVRLDDDAERALRALEASGLSRSEAIRASLLASAQRLRRGKDLAAEAAALEADEGDRAEMLSVATLDGVAACAAVRSTDSDFPRESVTNSAANASV